LRQINTQKDTAQMEWPKKINSSRIVNIILNFKIQEQSYSETIIKHCKMEWVLNTKVNCLFKNKNKSELNNIFCYVKTASNTTEINNKPFPPRRKCRAF